MCTLIILVHDCCTIITPHGSITKFTTIENPSRTFPMNIFSLEFSTYSVNYVNNHGKCIVSKYFLIFHHEYLSLYESSRLSSNVLRYTWLIPSKYGVSNIFIVHINLLHLPSFQHMFSVPEKVSERRGVVCACVFFF